MLTRDSIGMELDTHETTGGAIWVQYTLLTLNGGGYKFLSAGALVTQATLTLLLTSTNAALVSCCIKFTFDAASQIWIVEF